MAIVHGSGGSDTIDRDFAPVAPTDFSDLIYGGGLNDTITGLGGKDEIFGGSGDDGIWGDDESPLGSGDSDTIYGETGGDRLYGGELNDALYGAEGADFLYGGLHADKAYGGLEIDYLYGGDGGDRLYGDENDDRLWGGLLRDELYGGIGNDELDGGDDIDTLQGGAGNDTLIGAEGDDSLYGGDGFDSIFGGDGDDFLTDMDGNATIYGGRGNDIAFAGFNKSTLKGDAGNDELFGADGDDLVEGGTGDDRIFASLGKDKLYGGEGDDIFDFRFDAAFLQNPNGVIQTVHGGAETNGKSDVLLLPGAPNHYAIETLVGSSFAKTKTKITYIADNRSIILDTWQLEKARFEEPLEIAEPLAAADVVAEMALLTALSYQDMPRDEVLPEEWHALSAIELGIQPSNFGLSPYRYSLVDGDYRASDPFTEARALIGTRFVDGALTLTIAFRGTVNLAQQAPQYFPFEKHYKFFAPLIDAVKEYIGDPANGIEKVLVTGHSLGGSMVQLFLSEDVGVPVAGYTWGSPGAGNSPSPPNLINFAHTRDAVPRLGEAKDDRAGGIVTIDRNESVYNHPVKSHEMKRYIENTEFLIAQAKGPALESDPFARALLSGEAFPGHIYIELGTDKSDVLRPLAKQAYSLAGGGNDKFVFAKKHLLADSVREVDGGPGEDKVLLPLTKSRRGDGAVFKVSPHEEDDSVTVYYDSEKGSKDLWGPVATFYRVERILYADKKSAVIGVKAKALSEKTADLDL